MKHLFLKQSWLALKIWVIALTVNTLAGSLYLAGDLDQELMFAGLIFGTIVSSPIPVILMIVINSGVSKRKSGQEIFWQIFTIGLALTIFFTICFLAFIGGGMLSLLFIACLAAIIGISSQYYACLKLANYYDEYEKFLA